MRCEVVLLRRNGMRLKRSEWPAPVRGDLRLVDMAERQTSFRRNIRMMELFERTPQWQRAVLKPLADPQMIGVVADGFVLSGIELDVVEEGGERRTVERQQLWLCRPV